MLTPFDVAQDMLRYTHCAGYSGRTAFHPTGYRPVRLSALHSKAYRSMSGEETAENIWNNSRTNCGDYDVRLGVV